MNYQWSGFLLLHAMKNKEILSIESFSGSIGYQFKFNKGNIDQKVYIF